MIFSLLNSPWLPIRRASGARSLIRPAEIVAGFDDPVVALDWPRADFRFASLEFLIGLLATACPPADSDDWLDRWHTPPDVAALDAAFTPLAGAFLVDGPGPRFLQDMEELAADQISIGALLIEAPGANAVRNNTDLLVKRDRVHALSRGAAAMALFTLQAFAPAGGAGHRTSLRGGGPLSTLAVPKSAAGVLSLWHLLWANVPDGVPPAAAELSRVFPWLIATRVSDKGRTTTEHDAHPLQAFWGMPRRIRLDFSANTDGTPCDLTGAVDEVRVCRYRTRPYGANYDAWRHPLTPYYHPKTTDPTFLPVHPQPGGIGYRQWVGLVQGDSDGLRFPAAAITTFRADRVRELGASAQPWRLLAGGYDMDNMKARGFVESDMPVFEPSQVARDGYEQRVRRALDGAGIVASLLGHCVRNALFDEGAKADASAGVLGDTRRRFWTETQDDFFALLADLASAPGDAWPRLAIDWRDRMGKVAQRLFDDAAPLDPLAARKLERQVAARKRLVLALRGFGKDGTALHDELHLPRAEAARKKPAKPAKEPVA